MATIDDLHAALIKADAAGDTDGAKALSDHIRSLSAAAPQSGGFLDGAKNFGLGLVKGVTNPIDGAAQLLTKGLSTATHYVAPGSSVDNYMQGQAGDVAAINQDREDKYQAMTPGSIAAGVGNVLGNIAVPLPGANVVKGGSLAIKAANALKSGAVIGAAQPVYNTQAKLSDLVTGNSADDYWEQKAKQVGIGAALGGALSGAGSFIGGAYNTIRPIISPSSTVGNQLLGNLEKASAAEVKNGAPTVDATGLTKSNPETVLANLKNNSAPIVPGSFPTTAQVAGSPELVMAEKTLRNTPSYTPAFMAREASNNAARNQAVSNVAQTPEALKAAIKARSGAADPLYDAFNQQQIPIDGKLNGLLNTPIGLDAVKRAQAIAQNKQQPFNLSQPTDASSVPSSLLGANGQPAFQTAIPAADGTMDGLAANRIKLAIDQMRKTNPTSSIESHEQNALNDVRNDFVNHLDSTNPTFQQARQAYASGSVPVNTMQAGQDLQKELSVGAWNTNDEVMPTLTKYAGKLNSILDKQNYPLDPDALAALKNVHLDLQRRSVSDSVPKSGSDTAWNAQAPNWLSSQILGQNLDGNSLLGRGLGAGLGFLSGGLMGGAGGVALMQKGGQWIGNRVNSQLQDAMMNPAVFQSLLEEAAARKGGASVINNLSPVGARAATYGAENTLSPSR